MTRIAQVRSVAFTGQRAKVRQPLLIDARREISGEGDLVLRPLAARAVCTHFLAAAFNG